jgi:hypothetical protein
VACAFASMCEREVRELGACLGLVISMGCGFYIFKKDLPVLETALVSPCSDLSVTATNHRLYPLLCEDN